MMTQPASACQCERIAESLRLVGAAAKAPESPIQADAAALGPVFDGALVVDVRLFGRHTLIESGASRCVPLPFAITRGASAGGENREPNCEKCDLNAHFYLRQPAITLILFGGRFESPFRNFGSGS